MVLSVVGAKIGLGRHMMVLEGVGIDIVLNVVWLDRLLFRPPHLTPA